MTMPAAVELNDLCRELLELRKAGDVVYVHCANGRGRSASVVATCLVLSGVCADVDAAFDLFRKRRPQCHIKIVQKRVLEEAILLPGGGELELAVASSSGKSDGAAAGTSNQLLMV